MREFRELLACPACAGPISAAWSCDACGARFDARVGSPGTELEFAL